MIISPINLAFEAESSDGTITMVHGTINSMQLDNNATVQNGAITANVETGTQVTLSNLDNTEGFHGEIATFLQNLDLAACVPREFGTNYMNTLGGAFGLLLLVFVIITLFGILRDRIGV